MRKGVAVVDIAGFVGFEGLDGGAPGGILFLYGLCGFYRAT
jgi:hypothetical protein